jgi:hypothetical protein
VLCLAGIAIILVGGLGLAYATGIILPREGPLSWSSSVSSGAGGLVDPNQRFSYGLLGDITNRGDRPATVSRIEILGVTSGLHLVGAYVNTPEAAPGVGFVSGYPPAFAPAERGPVRGTVVKPGESVDIVLGFVVTGEGRYVFRGVRLYYKVGFTNYRATYPLVMWACAPVAKYVRVSACASAPLLGG